MSAAPFMREHAQTALVALLSAVAGASLALRLAGDPSSTPPTTDATADVAALQERVALLEQRLADVDVATNYMPEQPSPEALSRAGGPTPAANDPADFQASRDAQLSERQRRRDERFGNRLREAGWTDADIDALDGLREKLGLELEQRQYEAMREAILKNPETVSPWWGRQDMMRDALGDEKYEQYLQAAGRPVAVEVGSVLAGSAGDAAGLRPGDSIRRYGSERVYNDRDLMFAMLNGDPGEAVSIEVERDGATFFITAPRGPLGTFRMGRFGPDF